VVHLVFDLVYLYKLVDWQYPVWFAFVMDWGGVLFLLIFGICVTLGHRGIRRGLIVIACGFVCSLVTWGMYRLNMAGQDIIIYFGVLHCLGCCMLLWPVFRRLHLWALGLFAFLALILGLYTETLTGQTFWWIPLGVVPAGFVSADYFPLLPHLGWFLWGTVLGHTLYGKKESLFPGAKHGRALLSILQWIGRQSLPVYLLHQPVLSALCLLL
jgi:uncharacterized membrane protein